MQLLAALTVAATHAPCGTAGRLVALLRMRHMATYGVCCMIAVSHAAVA